MSWIGDTLRSWRPGTAIKAAMGQALPVVPSWVRYSILKPDFQAMVREAYQKNAAVFACVSALTFAFPEPPVQVFETEHDDSPIIPNHPLRTLLRKPNPIMGEAELMAITMGYCALGGNAFWQKVRNRRGQVVEVYPYHAGNIRIVPGTDAWIKGYQFNDGTGIWDDVDAADIVHFKWPLVDPTQPWQAQPPLLAAAAEVDSDTEATVYLMSLLKNDAVPRTVLKVAADRNLSDEEVRRMKAQWKERYGGKNKGEVAILEGGTTVDRLGLDMQQLAFDALHRMPETRIAAAFRVPAIVAGLNSGLENSTYSNYGQARTAMTEDTLIPLWRVVSSEIAADLLPEMRGPLGDCRFDLKRVRALQENVDNQWRRVTNGWNSGLLKKNEARRALGYPDDPTGDIFKTTGRELLAAPTTAQPTEGMTP